MGSNVRSVSEFSFGFSLLSSDWSSFGVSSLVLALGASLLSERENMYFFAV